jgi:hypothetical protein
MITRECRRKERLVNGCKFGNRQEEEGPCSKWGAS